MRYRTAVFDFDGTIADTREPITLSANRALAERGFAERPPADVLELVGLPLAEVLRRLAELPAGDGEVDELCVHYRAAFRELAPGRSALFDGIVDVIEQLVAAGVRLSIATSRSRESLENFLDEHALRAHFVFWAGGHCITNGKPHPEMLAYVLAGSGFAREEAIMIGDTSHDIEMGHAAGVDTCAVSYGNHDADRLRRSEPTFLVHATHELPRVVLSHA
ncbi:MAG: HAD family hydrolase [Planctomycetota bacterium]